MKRFFVPSLIALALVMGAAGATPAAHAQADVSIPPDVYSAALGSAAAPAQTQAKTFYDSCIAQGNSTADCQGGYDQILSNSTLTATPDPKAAKIATDPALGSDGDKFGVVMTWIMSLFAWLVGVAALTLDYAVYYTVITMGNYVNHLSAVGVTWRILRDIGNIFLIFGFLAVGITTILNVDWYGGGKKMLPMMLVAAVFLNFSLFIAEAVVDTGNLFATQFFTQINGGVMPTPTTLSNITVGTWGSGNLGNEGISNKIMGQLGLQTIYNGGNVNADAYKAGNTWLIGFMGIILFLVTAFVMFSLAFVLIFRFVALVFLIIIAPIGFAGLAVPGFAARAHDWWEQLFHQTITAPILLMMLYIALAIITDVQFLTGMCGNGTCTKNWLGFVSGNDLTGFASMILSFLVAMGLLFAVVVYAKRWSAFGGDMASKLAGKLTFGATAFVARRTVGRASNFAARKIRSSSLGRTETGRLLAGVADRGAKGSFDLRGTGALKNVPFASTIALGDAQKGGYRAREDELVKARTDYAKSLRQSAGQKEATKAAQEEHDKNMAPLEAEEQAQLKATKEIVNASREELKLKREALEVVRRSGDADRIKTTEAAYNNDMNTHKELVEAEREKLDPIRDKMETEKKRLAAATASNSVEANQRKYGEALQSGPIMKIIRAPYDSPTARREASDKIISESKKDKNQKNLDKFEAILAKAEWKVDSGSPDKKPT